MGLFLQTAVIPNCKEAEARAVIEKIAGYTFGEPYEFSDLCAEECRYNENNTGVSILFNDGCAGYEGLAEAVSKELGKTVLLTYIYDEDFWGYFLYENGRELDRFCPMPDYFEEQSGEEREKMKGDASVISHYFGVDEASVTGYLCEWTEEMMDNYEEKAYEDDEFEQCDCWQMVDFMRKLGYPYEWED